MKISTVSGAFLLLKNPIVSENIISGHKKKWYQLPRKTKKYEKISKNLLTKTTKRDTITMEAKPYQFPSSISHQNYHSGINQPDISERR